MNTEQERAELLPCPFCGGTDIEIQIGTPDREGVPTNLMCSDCGASGPWDYEHGNSHAKADAAWNHRTTLQSQSNYDGTLFCDLKTDDEKFRFFLSGRGYETGVIARSIQNDVAMAYYRCAKYKKELEALREDAERYRYLSSMATQQADSLGPIFRIDVRRTPQTLFSFDASVDHALSALTKGGAV